MPLTESHLVLGTRASPLARAQAGWTAERLRALWPGVAVEERVIDTAGDRDRTSPLSMIGGQGVFVKELERALEAGLIDVAVHSLKDVPGRLPDGLAILAVPLRADARDCLVLPATPTESSTQGHATRQDVAEPPAELHRLPLPLGARVGTSSQRRAAQLRAARPDLDIRDVRGNVDTRLRKLDQGDYDALILAAAGLDRLGRGARAQLRLAPSLCVPAVAQGALGLEGRAGCPELAALLHPLSDFNTQAAVTAERTVLRGLEAGCTVPLGAYARVAERTLTLHAFVSRPDGTGAIRIEVSGSVQEPEAVGREAVELLLSRGAGVILNMAMNASGSSGPATSAAG